MLEMFITLNFILFLKKSIIITIIIIIIINENEHLVM